MAKQGSGSNTGSGNPGGKGNSSGTGGKGNTSGAGDKGAGWPSTTGGKSGGGRDNATK